MSMPQAKLGDLGTSPLFIAFAALLLVSHLYFKNQFPKFINPNEASRLYTTLALVDDGSFAIDGPMKRYPPTQDKAEREGHIYSDKGPGVSVALAPIAWLLRKSGIPIEDYRGMLSALRVLGVSLPLVGFWIWLLPRFGRLGGGRELAIAVLLSGALGTSFFIYATGLFAHAIAGALLFASWWIGVRSRHAEPVGGSTRDFIAGLFAGIAFTADFLVMLAVAVLFFLCVARDRGLGRRGFLFGAGVAVVLAAWMAHNQACFGHPLRVGFHFHTDATYGALYRGGFLGIHPPRFEALLGLTLSPIRGLFFASPVLLLAFPGWLRLARDPETRADAIGASAVFAAVLLFATTTIEWKGGWSMGARYLVPTIPFLLVGVMGFLRDRAPESRAPFVFAVLASVGIGGVALAAASFSAFPYAFANPIYHFAVPLLRNGYHGDGLFLPSAMQGLAVAGYFALALASAVFISWSALVASQRRVPTAFAACGAAVLVMLVASAIPESASNLRDRDATAVHVIRMMGH
jgi:hypothetical protein